MTGLDQKQKTLVAGSILIVALVFILYRHILPGQFLMDDWRLIATDNPLTNGQLTPLNLWFQTDFTLSTFALWLEHLAWGGNPGWYHFVNLCLHAVSAVLIWRLLTRLNLPGAWLGAALFAVHPVCVNSVARVAEIKNTLALPFFLASFLAYLHYEAETLSPIQGQRWRASGWYALALLAFIAALLSKTSTIMLPAILILSTAWRHGRLKWTDWPPLLAFFGLSLAFGLMSIWFQIHQALFSAGETPPPEDFWQRFAIAGHVLQFYLVKALWPLDLNLVYPQWNLHLASPVAWWPWMALVALVAPSWYFRATWGRHVLFVLGCYMVALFPVLGFFDSQFLIRWQVSDHLQYLALIAPLAGLAAGLATCLKTNAFRASGIILIAAFSLLTFQRTAIFSSDEALLRDSITGNPNASFARDNYGVILAKRNDLAGAMQQFQASLEASPDDENAQANLAHALALKGDLAAAETHYQAALQLQPQDVETHKNFAQQLVHEGRFREAAFHDQVALDFKPDVRTRLDLASLYYRCGNPENSVAQFRQVIKEQPENAEALNNLAWLLATTGNAQVRNGAEAVGLAEKACRLTGYKNPQMTGSLAAAYAEAGRYPDAVAWGQNTIKLAQDSGNTQVFNTANQLLVLYQNHLPYHEPLAQNADGP